MSTSGQRAITQQVRALRRADKALEEATHAMSDCAAVMMEALQLPTSAIPPLIRMGHQRRQDPSLIDPAQPIEQALAGTVADVLYAGSLQSFERAVVQAMIASLLDAIRTGEHAEAVMREEGVGHVEAIARQIGRDHGPEAEAQWREATRRITGEPPS